MEPDSEIDMGPLRNDIDRFERTKAELLDDDVPRDALPELTWPIVEEYSTTELRIGYEARLRERLDTVAGFRRLFERQRLEDDASPRYELNVADPEPCAQMMMEQETFEPEPVDFRTKTAERESFRLDTDLMTDRFDRAVRDWIRIIGQHAFAEPVDPMYTDDDLDELVFDMISEIEARNFRPDLLLVPDTIVDGVRSNDRIDFYGLDIVPHNVPQFDSYVCVGVENEYGMEALWEDVTSKCRGVPIWASVGERPSTVQFKARYDVNYVGTHPVDSEPLVCGELIE